MNPVARCAKNLHREFSMAAEAAITAIGETSAKFSQITHSDRFTEQWEPPAVYQIEFSYAPRERNLSTTSAQNFRLHAVNR
jgi:hypothetical protein